VTAARRTRVVLCGCDGLFSGLALAQLVAHPGIEIVGVVRSTRILNRRYGLLRGAWHQIRRSGFAYAAYLWSATTCAELLIPCSLGRLTRRYGIPVLATRDINSAAALAFVRDSDPDVLVSAFFNQRIGPAVLAVPRTLALNIHPSLLPAFRGVDPVFFVRLRGAQGLGVTLHMLDAEFDTGDILLQAMLTAPATDSVLRTTARLFFLGGQLLAPLITEPQGQVPAAHAQPESGSYDSWPTPQEVRGLRQTGVALLHATDLSWAWRTSNLCPGRVAARPPDAQHAHERGGHA
jgi:methionyl-tRNA formyltransferase